MGFFDRMRSAFSEVDKFLANSDKTSEQKSSNASGENPGAPVGSASGSPSAAPVVAPIRAPSIAPSVEPSDIPAGASSGLLGARLINLTGEPPVATPGGTPKVVGAPTGMAAMQMQAQANGAAAARMRMQAENMNGVSPGGIGGIGFGAIGGMPGGIGNMSPGGMPMGGSMGTPGAMPGQMPAGMAGVGMMSSGNARMMTQAEAMQMKEQATADLIEKIQERMKAAEMDPTGSSGAIKDDVFDQLQPGMALMIGMSPLTSFLVAKGMPFETARMEESRMSLMNPNEYPWRRLERTNRYAQGITIERQVVLDEKGIKIQAMKYDANTIKDDYLEVVIENATAEIAIVKFSNVIVNGYCVSPIAGQIAVLPKLIQKMKFDNLRLGVWMLEVEGIRAFGQIDFHISVMGMEGSGMDRIDKDVSIRTSAYDQMDNEIKNPGKELIVCDGIRVSGKYVGDESAFPTSYASIWLENISGADKAVCFYRYSYVDGRVRTTVYSNMILENGRKALIVFTVDDDQEVEKIEGSLQVTPVGASDLPEPVIFELPFHN